MARPVSTYRQHRHEDEILGDIAAVLCFLATILYLLLVAHAAGVNPFPLDLTR